MWWGSSKVNDCVATNHRHWATNPATSSNGRPMRDARCARVRACARALAPEPFTNPVRQPLKLRVVAVPDLAHARAAEAGLEVVRAEAGADSKTHA